MTPTAAHDLAIVGLGAAGLMAAIFAGRHAPPNTRIVGLDGARKLGAKILVAGGGRCNVTHDVVTPDDYVGSSRHAVARVLRSFTVEQTIDFFADLGVRLKREPPGKLFPTTDRAQTVLDALLSAARDAGADLRTDHRVTPVERTDAGFRLTTPHGPIDARCLILATGGKSLPRTGSDGAGYAFAQHLGHTVTRTHPALVPLVLEPGLWLTSLSGVSVEADLALAGGTGKVRHRQRGSMLLTHFGLSGPAVMDMSRHWIAAHLDDPGVRLTVSFVPDATFQSLEVDLVNTAQRRPRMRVGDAVHQWLPERLAWTLVEHGAGVDPATPLGQLSRERRRAIVHALTALPLPVMRDRGYLFAEVTAGGVPLEEVNLATMASRRCEGLYLCGEILNVDGRIGGYNFQWAWATGRLAGIGAVGE